MEQPAHKPAVVAGCHIIASPDPCSRQRSVGAAPRTDNKTHTTSAERRHGKQRKERSASKTHESNTPFVLPETPFLNSPVWSVEDCIDAERYNKLFRRRRNASLQRRLREQRTASLENKDHVASPPFAKALDAQPAGVLEPPTGKDDASVKTAQDKPGPMCGRDKAATKRRRSTHQSSFAMSLVPLDHSLHLPYNLPRLVLDEPGSMRKASATQEQRRLEIFPGKPLRRPSNPLSIPPLLPAQESYDIVLQDGSFAGRTCAEGSVSDMLPVSLMTTQPGHTTPDAQPGQSHLSSMNADDRSDAAVQRAISPSAQPATLSISLSPSPPPTSTLFANNAASYLLSEGSGMMLMHLWDSESVVSQSVALTASTAHGLADSSQLRPAEAGKKGGGKKRCDVTDGRQSGRVNEANALSSPKSPMLSWHETSSRRTSDEQDTAKKAAEEAVRVQMFYDSWIRQFLPFASMDETKSALRRTSPPTLPSSHTLSATQVDGHTSYCMAGEQPGYVVKADTASFCHHEPHDVEAYHDRHSVAHPMDSAESNTGPLCMLARANTTHDSPCTRLDDVLARAGLGDGEYDFTTTVHTTRSLPCIMVDPYNSYDGSVIGPAHNRECEANGKEETVNGQLVQRTTRTFVAASATAGNTSAKVARPSMRNVLVAADRAACSTAGPQVQYSPHRHGTTRLRMHVTDVSSRALLARQAVGRDGKTALMTAIPSPRKMKTNNTIAQLEPGRVELGRYTIVRTNSAMRATGAPACVPRATKRSQVVTATTTRTTAAAVPAVSAALLSSSPFAQCTKWHVVEVAATTPLTRHPSLMANSYFSVWGSSRLYPQGM